MAFEPHPTPFASNLLEHAKARDELAVGGAQSFVGVDAVLQCELGQDPQQVAEFLAAFGQTRGLEQFGELFADFVERALTCWPVESSFRGLASQLGSPLQLWQVFRDTVERRSCGRRVLEC